MYKANSKSLNPLSFVSVIAIYATHSGVRGWGRGEGIRYVYMRLCDFGGIFDHYPEPQILPVPTSESSEMVYEIKPLS